MEKMSSIFSVAFNINGNFFNNMIVTENMIFDELVKNFYRYVSLEKENEARFFFNSNEIKSDSKKNLKELGIQNMSVIEVKTKTPIKNQNMGMNYQPMGNMGMNSFQPMGNMGMNSFQPMGNMGMNPMANFGMSPMGYIGMNLDEEFININFNNSGRIIQIKAKKNDIFSNISRKFCEKAALRYNEFPNYFLGSRKIDSKDNQTLSQLHIHNNSEISVLLSSDNKEEFLHIIFSSQGKFISLQESSKTRFCDLSKKYCLKAGIQDKTLVFLLRSRKIESNDTRTLAELEIKDQSKIEVVFTTEVIGA